MSFCMGVSCQGCGQRNCPNESPISDDENVWLWRDEVQRLEKELAKAKVELESARKLAGRPR